jgi:hypothetical protein
MSPLSSQMIHPSILAARASSSSSPLSYTRQLREMKETSPPPWSGRQHPNVLRMDPPSPRLLVRPTLVWRWCNVVARGIRPPPVFILLFNSRDNVIHPQGICGLGNTKETSYRPSASVLLQKKSSALGSALCARRGVQAPLAKEI